MRRAKIVCTLGPATSSPQQIRALVDAGMDIARLNLSHGEYSVHEEIYRSVRKASDETGRAVGILVDLQGPKIRTGRFADGPITLAKGDRFTITILDVPGDQDRVSTTYKGMPGDVRPGDMLLVDDGKVSLRAVQVTATDIITEAVEGGVISNNKGINLPGVAVNVPAMSDKDKADLRWGLNLRADMIALSFVRSAKDLDDVHAIMDEVGVRLPVIAKVEASDCANAVLDGADAIMLSGETSVGAWPIEAVQTMARIIESTEDHGLERIHALGTKPHTTGGAVTWAAAEIGELLGVKYLVTFTQSGDSALRMARIRSKLPMLAFTPLQDTRSQLALVWGIETFLVPMARHTDQMALEVDNSLLASGKCVEGDVVIIVAGSPPGIPGSTNALRVHRIGDAKNKVAPAYQDLATP